MHNLHKYFSNSDYFKPLLRSFELKLTLSCIAAAEGLDVIGRMLVSQMSLNLSIGDLKLRWGSPSHTPQPLRGQKYVMMSPRLGKLVSVTLNTTVRVFATLRNTTLVQTTPSKHHHRTSENELKIDTLLLHFLSL